MTIRLAYITTARSDYGPSYWLIHDLMADARFDVRLIVGGSHLSLGHGITVAEIEHDGWPIAARVPFLEDGDDDPSFGRSCGRALTAHTEIFSRVRPDIAIVYGDRLELLPIVTAAVITRTPVTHLCGGDLTEGLVDEQVRHAVTKMAHLHFPSTQLSAVRILQMGEESWRVHTVGDPALDHFVRGKCASVEELAAVLGFVPDRTTLLVTFHPVTLEEEDVPRQAAELAAALADYDGPLVITAPAPDPGSAPIRAAWERLAATRPQTVFVESLGSYRYRGLMRLVGALVGNSSSGLNEAPCVPLPAVNIGSRQKGRERAANVLDVPPQRATIERGIRTALSAGFRESLREVLNPYGDGHAAPRIVDVLRDCPIAGSCCVNSSAVRRSPWRPQGRACDSVRTPCGQAGNWRRFPPRSEWTLG